MIEMRMFAVHITQKNALRDVMRDEVVTLIRKHRGAAAGPAAQKDPARYLASMLFLTRKQQKEFARDCRKLGLDVEIEKQSAFARLEGLP